MNLYILTEEGSNIELGSGIGNVGFGAALRGRDGVHEVINALHCIGSFRAVQKRHLQGKPTAKDHSF